MKNINKVGVYTPDHIVMILEDDFTARFLEFAGKAEGPAVASTGTLWLPKTKSRVIHYFKTQKSYEDFRNNLSSDLQIVDPIDPIEDHEAAANSQKMSTLKYLTRLVILRILLRNWHGSNETDKREEAKESLRIINDVEELTWKTEVMTNSEFYKYYYGVFGY